MQVLNVDPEVKAAIEQYKVMEYTWRLNMTESRILQDLIDALNEDQYREYERNTSD